MTKLEINSIFQKNFEFSETEIIGFNGETVKMPIIKSKTDGSTFGIMGDIKKDEKLIKKIIKEGFTEQFVSCRKNHNKGVVQICYNPDKNIWVGFSHRAFVKVYEGLKIQNGWDLPACGHVDRNKINKRFKKFVDGYVVKKDEIKEVAIAFALSLS